MWGKKPGEARTWEGERKFCGNPSRGTLPLDGWVRQSAGDGAAGGAVPQGRAMAKTQDGCPGTASVRT